ncbi:uncharacterized protein H6S33_000717 [Morchella sextelata]|uniref:uncharacterized protein n=1 Tax=Morchella sextelata TaxID=1174677 RepID=UPI001D051730|nr:uncharacterized protein H6S33_000717 [Morchella sextelata]KAH0615081.1 hypothetical protein H6S33_000717 [Morchella sextelata]
MSALSLLKQAHDLMSGKGVPDLVRRIGPGIKRIKAWQIPPKHFSVWLGILSADWERVKNPKSDYGCLIVNIGGDCSWKITDGQIMLLPYEYKVVDDVGLGRRSKKINARIVTCGNDAPIIEVSQSWAASKYERLWVDDYGPGEYGLSITRSGIKYTYVDPRELMEDLSSVIAKMESIYRLPETEEEEEEEK